MTLSVTPKTRTITNGTANDGSVVEAEMLELYNNDQTIATYVNNMTSGGVAFNGITLSGMLAETQGPNLTQSSGVLTPAGGNSFIVNSTVAPITSISTLAAGIKITLIFSEAGFVLTNSATLILQGNVNYTTSVNDNFTFISLGGGTWQEISRCLQNAPQLPQLYEQCSPLLYSTASTATMVSILCKDSTGSFDIRAIGANATLNSATVGLGGLDTGTIAASTHYCVYAVTSSILGTTGLMMSTINESVTGTLNNTNYAYTSKRQLRMWITTDVNGNFIPWVMGAMGQHPVICYTPSISPYGTAHGSINATGLALLGSSYASYTLTPAIPGLPPGCTNALLNISADGGPPTALIPMNGQSSGGTSFIPSSNGPILAPVNTTSAQKLYVEVTNNGSNYVIIEVVQFTVAGIP